MSINYEFTHPDYNAHIEQWRANRDAVEGEAALKKGKTTYLPDPTPSDTSQEARDRYASYIKRAVYFNAVGRTVTGLVGIAFGDWPEIQLPTSLEYILDDADGLGVGLIGQAQLVCAELLTEGRGGILVDYPQTAGAVSVAEQREGGIVARSVFYRAEDIHDWDVTRVGSRLKLSMVKLRETRRERSDDGFSLVDVPVYRILRLEEGRYTQEILKKTENGWVSEGKTSPLDAAGTPWDEIPFTFVGAVNNDHTVDRAPIADMVAVNLGHYRNSADYEESVFMLGQPQITMTGLDEQWRDHLEKSGIYFGSRRVLMGPVNSTIGLLQVQPNTLAAEAMKTKKEELVALGARLLQPGSVAKTAEQSKSETRAAYSVLSLICDNVSAAYTRVLGWVQRYMGGTGEVDFAIDTEFDGLTVNAELVKVIIAAVQAGLVPKSDAFSALRRLNLIDQGKTDEEIKDELESDGPALASVLDPLNPARAGGPPGSTPPGRNTPPDEE